MQKFSRAFTIVELLVVVIVIGILASVTIVAYNGAQERAEFARAKTDMKHINDALIIYKSQNGSYPTTTNGGTGSGWIYQHPTPGGAANTSFLSELVPTYLDKMPLGSTKSGHVIYSYLYNSDGTDYKLLRFVMKDWTYVGLPQVEKTNNPLIDASNGRGNMAWGYWSNGAELW